MIATGLIRRREDGVSPARPLFNGSRFVISGPRLLLTRNRRRANQNGEYENGGPAGPPLPFKCETLLGVHDLVDAIFFRQIQLEEIHGVVPRIPADLLVGEPLQVARHDLA
jgi:hypothetical protein